MIAARGQIVVVVLCLCFLGDVVLCPCSVGRISGPPGRF